jgi:hypothetical protein
MNTAIAKNIDTDPEDIDLLLLVERAMRFFSRFKWLFITAFLAGIAVGFLLYKSLPRVYKSRMIVHSFVLTNQEEIEIANNWNDLLKRDEHEMLAQAFNCRKDILEKLKSIKAAEIQKVFTPTNPNGFSIEVMVTDNSILPELQHGIVYGFENSPYVKERIAFKKANYQDLIDKTTTEISKLDSTKGLIENILKGKGKSSSSFIINGSDINRQWLEMNQGLLSLKEELQFTNAVQVLQGFSTFREPAGPHLVVWIIVSLVFFLALAYIYALFKTIREKLKRRSQQNILTKM